MKKKHLKRVKRWDRIARYVITIGGVGVIFSVMLILFLIARVTFPLFQSPSIERQALVDVSSVADATVLQAGVDDYLESVFTLQDNGSVTFYATESGQNLETVTLLPPGEGLTVADVERSDPRRFDILWSDGSLTMEEVRFLPHFDAEGRRSFERRVERLATLEPPVGGLPQRFAARSADEDSLVRVCLLADGALQVDQQVSSEDLFGEQATERFRYNLDPGLVGERITALTMDSRGTALYAGTDQGTLLRWDLSDPEEPLLLDRLPAFTERKAITALCLILGDISLAVGDADGGVTTWFPVASEASGGVKRLHHIHTLTSHRRAVVRLLPSLRDKSLLSIDEQGIVHLDHMTSERNLLDLTAVGPLREVALSRRGDGLVGIDEQGRAAVWRVNNPHPEVSWKTLFGKVWYESYDEPAYAWQSSSASDDFEPKLSLTPLVFGTIKGTAYAMLFAVPLALLGAIYTSQFGSDKLRGVIKPAVEVMAAVPSVIIGFLAALWFAPLLEKSVTALFLSVLFVPTFLLVALVLWQLVRNRPWCKRIAKGHEFLLLAPVLVAAVACALMLGPAVESWFFGGDFKLWLFTEAGSRYDPRNNIVISFALGFAVIPIIFTIAEDSLSNVPQSLRAASLALGASRWQTVKRVILPSASPGIFAGTMIGFGRAIGETMIVLMATGNTAIMDWSIFNGMRPMSSNIAVEIPEAPHGGTLYRVLFLSAVLLFLMTFVLNTVAEVVRQRLRKKYGRF
jgi:phosphate transport system permease protein